MIFTLPINLERAHALSEALTQFVENSNEPEKRTASEQRRLLLVEGILEAINVFIVEETTSERYEEGCAFERTRDLYGEG